MVLKNCLQLKQFKWCLSEHNDWHIRKNGVYGLEFMCIIVLIDNASWPSKKFFFIQIPKKGSAKECSNYHIIALISHASKVMLKILQARVQQCLNREFPDVQAGFRKGRGTRDQIVNNCWIIEKAREYQKNISFCFVDYAKAFVYMTTSCGKFWKRWEYETTWPASWEICVQVNKKQLEPDIEQ